MSDMEYLVDQERVDWPAVWDLAKFTGWRHDQTSRAAV